LTLPISDKEAQSLRISTGTQFEKNVAYVITDLLISENIYATSLKNLKESVVREPGLNQVLEFAKLPLRSPCRQTYEMVLPDSDVIVYYVQKDHSGNVKKRFHLATISCKVSFHARETESAFWASALRNHGSKFVLATEDKFDELKTCEMGNKARRVLESYMDGIYMMKQYGNRKNDLIKDIARFYEVFQKSKQSGYVRQGSTIFDEGRKQGRYCKQVRPFDDLVFDLMKWKFEFES
jgi:hypothetical protein